MATTGARVGERLRAIRRQKGLSLHDVEARSSLEFKASVLGAYERGERAISVPRLLRLAEIYEVPADQLLPRELEGEISLVDGPGGVDRPDRAASRSTSCACTTLDDPDAQILSRFATVDPARAPGLQRPHAHDPALRPAGARVVHGPQPRGARRRGSSSSASAPSRLSRARATRTPAGSGDPRATLSAPWQRLARPVRPRPPRSRSWSRATTSWWACSASATSCCAWSKPRSRCRSSCAATRSRSPATAPTPNASAACSRSWSCCSNRATSSTATTSAARSRC